MCVDMIYLVCTKCGFSIDIIEEGGENNPVRAKRIKYLTTRGQVCPNCLNTIGKCERIDAGEDDIPIMRVDLKDPDREKFVEFCRANGYAVGTEYALREFQKVPA